MRLLLVTGLLCAVAMPALAQAIACVPPDTGLTAAGAATFSMASGACKKVNFADPLGPIVTFDTKVKTGLEPLKPWAPPARETARIEVPKPIDVEVAPEGESDMDFDYNTRQAMSLGRMDALQGHPMNMKYAGNLGYLKGYTRGQEEKLKPNGGNGTPRK